MSLRTVKNKIILPGHFVKKWSGFDSVFRALNRVSRFSEQIAPPQQTSRFTRSKILFHEVPYKDKEKMPYAGCSCRVFIGKLYVIATLSSVIRKKTCHFNKYYFSGDGDFYKQYDELNIIFFIRII